MPGMGICCFFRPVRLLDCMGTVRVLLVNQFRPPDMSPTSRLLGDLAEALVEDGLEVRFAGAAGGYRKDRGGRAARWLREIRALSGLFLQCLRGPRPDVIVALSSPPCLVALAAMAAAWHRARLLHWVMDLYPEIALALGEIREGAPARLVRWMMRRAYARCERVVALDADMRNRLANYGVDADIMPPWIPGNPAMPPPGSPLWSCPRDAVWLYSGNLGRAHEWKTLIDVQAALERRGSPLRLVVQGDGPSRTPAEACARDTGIRQVEWRDYAPADTLAASLLSAAVLVATQNPDTLGCLWPSKLALATRLPRPILWIGPRDGAVAAMLAESPENGVFAPGDVDNIADWLENTKKTTPAPRPGTPPDPAALRQPSLERWRRYILKAPGN